VPKNSKARANSDHGRRGQSSGPNGNPIDPYRPVRSFDDNAPLLSIVARSLGRILNLGNGVTARLARADHRQDRLVGVDVDRRFVFVP
jgi:hypothetical protein